MPTNLPSSFASAAAGQNANRGGRAGNSNDWSRRDGRSANGTLTLRRSSTTPLSQHSQNPSTTDSALQSPSIESQSANHPGYELSPSRYKKEELLAMAQPPRYGAPDVSRLYSLGWNPGHVNGGASRAWGKSNENHIPQEPGACWNDNGDSLPLSLQTMSLEEREAFSSDINSPVKPPTMNKEGPNTTGINGRKASVSQGAGNAFGVSSPSSATRPGARRRETSDANPFSLTSPTATGRTGREDAPWLSRRNTEKDTEHHEDETSSRVPGPIGNLMRSNTAGSSNMASLWGNSQPTTPSFGGGGFGNFAIGGPVAEKKPAAGVSRLAHLIPKDGEGAPNRPAEAQGALNQQSWRSRPRTDTDPFGEDMPSGSAALGGSTEAEPGPQHNNAGTLGTPVRASAGDFGMSGLNFGDDGPASPSQTNPYRSPPADRPQQDEASVSRQYPGLPQDVPSGYNPLQRAFTEGYDRSQTSSANRGFPIGNMSGWQAPGGPTVGTPDRERSNLGAGPFSPALFNSTDNIQSPSLGNLSNLFGPGASTAATGTNSIGRGSKLSSMFPAAMQAQMQQSQADADTLEDPATDSRFPSQLGAIGRNNFPVRDSESPMHSGRPAYLDDLYQQSDRVPHGLGQSTPGASGSFTPVSGNLPFGGSAAPPPADAFSHPRAMVMPDRMRWVYSDPQGQVQGPFSGLEMNDWYKANFFTPDLRVKKLEDHDFEPLGQLIRRIGNSREPFLVPQWGVSYGAPMPSGENPTPNNGGQVVPPLSSVFPSFGRTLTADEQNNLERRKQEEQFILAQQREYAMKQQGVSRFPGQQPGLQHHSSVQSLQSQPSFGSIASPIGGGMHGHMPQGQFSGMPPAGNTSGSFFEAVGEGRATLAQGTDIPLDEDELAHLSQNERSIFAALQEQHEAQQQQQQQQHTAAEMNFRTGLPEVDDLNPDDEGFRERLQEFNTLRAEHEAQEAARQEQAEETQPLEEPAPRQPGPARISKQKKSKKMIPLVHDDDAGLSLTEQVQQTQAAAIAAQTVVEPDMPMPFPPPSSSTPLPAPTAQRVRSNLPEQYNRSRSGSPEEDTGSAEPPPTAPWAKEASDETPKGPSLKQIQEAEARKAAQAELAASALRKAALEQEASTLREKEKQAAAAAAGLPASSTWGHTASPVSSGSPWTKPTVVKAPAPGLVQASSSTSKKTLAEIQAEEEKRKLKAPKDTGLQTNAPVLNSKSYANLAGKPGQPLPTGAGPSAAVAPPPGAGWATVGAGGKVKGPIGAGLASRAVSATQPKPSPAPLKPMSRPGPAAQASAPNTALDDFRNWVTRELSRGLSIVDYESFGQSLEALPLDTSLIADAIYANSTIMDGRHFSEEYVRRKKLADKGISEKAPMTESKASSGGGGWSEVAKKITGTPTNAGSVGAGPKEEVVPGFKVVAGKKKGKK